MIQWPSRLLSWDSTFSSIAWSYQNCLIILETYLWQLYLIPNSCSSLPCGLMIYQYHSFPHLPAISSVRCFCSFWPSLFFLCLLSFSQGSPPQIAQIISLLEGKKHHLTLVLKNFHFTSGPISISLVPSFLKTFWEELPIFCSISPIYQHSSFLHVWEHQVRFHIFSFQIWAYFHSLLLSLAPQSLCCILYIVFSSHLRWVSEELLYLRCWVHLLSVCQSSYPSFGSMRFLHHLFGSPSSA